MRRTLYTPTDLERRQVSVIEASLGNRVAPSTRAGQIHKPEAEKIPSWNGLQSVRQPHVELASDENHIEVAYPRPLEFSLSPWVSRYVSSNGTY